MKNYCYLCKSNEVIWKADFDADEIDEEMHGIIHEYHCKNCGAEITVYEPFDDGEKLHDGM